MLSEAGLERLWREIYDLTGEITPLHSDCGELCDSICCQDWEEGVGIYLYPGEEILLSGESWLRRTWHDTRNYTFPTAWDRGAWFVTCDARCPREMRPFGCRTFPLTADMSEDGSWRLILDPNGLPICPLIKTDARFQLRASFRNTMKIAWRKLLTVEAIRNDVLASSRRRRMRYPQEY